MVNSILPFPYLLASGEQLCFIHIGKTGGTSMMRVLDSMFDEDLICRARHFEELDSISPDLRAHYRVFRGHFGFKIREYLSGYPVYMTMLRSPFDRARSTYEHIHRHPHGRHGIVKNMTFEEYVDSDTSISLEIDNWQTRVLTDCIDPKAIPSISLAKERLEKYFPFVGITEEFDKSVSLLSYTFGLPEVKSIDRLNVTKDSISETQFGSGLRAKVDSMNQLDSELYEYGKMLFAQRIKLMDIFAK